MIGLPLARRVLSAAAFLLSAAAFVRSEPGELPAITPEETTRSLAEHGPAWEAKIEAMGRPRLLLDKAGLEAAREKWIADSGSQETLALQSAAGNIVSRGAPRYISPEDYAKSKGITPFDAQGQLWMRDVGNDIVALTIAAALQPSPVSRQALHDLVMTACRYPSWGQQAAAPANMDLACAHLARGIALAWDWFPELWTPEDRTLILDVIAERAGRLLAGLYGQAYWAKAYSDNHNHVDCAALAWCGIAFYTDIPQAPEWLAAARLDFQNVARDYPEDGSSAEGVPYWSYGMSFIVQYIEGARNIIDSADLYESAFLKNAAAFRLNSSTSGLEGTLPWGDGPPRDFYGPQHILRLLASEYADATAEWLAGEIPWPPQGGADVQAFNYLWKSRPAERPVLPLDHHAWVTDTAVTRSGWGGGDYLLAIKSGFTNRNHSHLDAGSLAFAFGGEWLLKTPGYGRGSGLPQFWDRNGGRWNFFSNSTESHSTLLINGKNQRHDRGARGTITQFLSTPAWMSASIDLSKAYRGKNRVGREILHRRGSYILVYDSFESLAPTPETLEVEWLAQLPAVPETDGKSLEIKGESGALRITMLSPPEPFSVRKPGSPQVDVDPSSLHTYRVKSIGDAVRFIALLEPVFGSASRPGLEARIVEQNGNYSHLVLQNEGSLDHIFHSAGPATFALGLAILNQAPEESAEQARKITATAATLAVSLDAGALSSCVAINATALDTPEIQLAPPGPAAIGLQKLPEGSWILDADQEVSQCITAPGFKILALPSERRAFRYLLAKNGADPESAAAFLAALVAFRERAPIAVRELPPQPPLPSPMVIPVEAEDFNGQSKGKAEIAVGKPGASGRSLRGVGNGAPYHVISWSFDVAQSGPYSLSIRYASKPDATAAILIDGAAPCQALTQLPLPSTGGWSIQEDNWKDLTVLGSGSNPYLFNLSQGRHTLSLAKPSAAIALDRFEFRGVPEAPANGPGE